MDDLENASTDDYEELRRQRIMKNKEKMISLGLLDASNQLLGGLPSSSWSREDLPFIQEGHGPGQRPKARRKRGSTTSWKLRSPAKPLRESKRLRGIAAIDAAGPGDQDGGPRQPSPNSGLSPNSEDIQPRDRAKKMIRKSLTLDKNVTFAAPFTLLSIQTTIWDLGSIFRGPWAQRYWSSKGCMFHHAYPVGYRASKSVFGKTFEMKIEAGATGPEFVVIDVGSGRVFRGQSPTKPWTDVCIAHRTGQRISGPLFFGFSDLTVQEAIASTLYSHRELEAALQGRTVESERLSPEEVSAKEFSSLHGVGEGVAAALARTESLGGKKHSGIVSLRCWLTEDRGKNQCDLENFLLCSAEIPASTRRWPAWRSRLVPRIMEQLLNPDDGSL